MIFLVLLMSWAGLNTTSYAVEWVGDVGAIHLPDSNYHYLGYATRLRFGEDRGHFVIDFGGVKPYVSHGVRQIIAFGGAGLEWDLTRDAFFTPYVGGSVAVYVDRVGVQAGWVPSLMTKAGLKMGPEAFGLDACVMNLVGVYDPRELTFFTVWPMINFFGGFYVHF